MLNRRHALQITAAAGAAALLPWDRLTGSSAPAATTTAAAAEAAPISPFAHAMPVPKVLAPVSSTKTSQLYELRMREAQVEIVKGLTSRVRTYGGTFPGPTIKASQGREVVVRQINELSVNTAVHLHGGHVRSEHDGLPMDTIVPGAERTYRYPNDQPAASLWYHDHAHHLEAENVYLGLHGLYLLSDRNERSLPLPTGAHDVPLVIRDARVEADGTLLYTRPSDCPHMLVNGKERPYFKVAARKYRLRIYNACANRYFKLRFADGAAFTQIGTDGGLLEQPVTRTELLMLGGERADIVVDFSRYREGSSIVLENTGALSTERPEVMRFDVGRATADHSYVPRRLASAPPVLPRRTVQRDFEIRTFPAMTINGLSYDPERVDVTARLGATEEWTIRNVDVPAAPGSPDFHLWHSFHTHLTFFRVLERNGQRPGIRDAGLKDTVTLGPGETVKIAMTWGPFTGEYVYHCHQLGHSSGGQMGRIDVVG
ncbi:multicopper oxidase family protein [Streptomyces sp. SID2119]|uniref:multicopper oxidase family protein n=1 Tax=Streptomyces sp. SID2119 TaxID=2690253 RepID=UPI00136BDFC2|nr:multicopper oxidase family protein [Streptomyces sp. SID2119]MYW30865.1 multicopper oxidase domain-containing protein [Streptomyces sp. SID2119]